MAAYAGSGVKLAVLARRGNSVSNWRQQRAIQLLAGESDGEEVRGIPVPAARRYIRKLSLWQLHIEDPLERPMV